ncbi:hypothetical protein [Vibrio vulnificus]|uniref:hypothetical protein n=1 Tax=Vibrio vulnificus TaxID=672 RepID=UPI00287988B3|nr:hypothetical protein [Vibrio vulnificus]
MNAAITISLAQIPVVRGDLPSNLAQHIYMIERSAEHDADVVVILPLEMPNERYLTVDNGWLNRKELDTV